MQLWSTPFLKGEMSDNQAYFDMTNYMLTLDYSADRGEDLFENNDAAIAMFKNRIVIPAFNKYLLETFNKTLDDWDDYALKSWAISGGNLPYHNHRGSQISAVFYMLVEGNGGEIVFTDPRQNANRGYDPAFKSWFENLVIDVKSGDYVIFPSFVYHFVNAYDGNKRLVIPVDLYLFNNSSAPNLYK